MNGKLIRFEGIKTIPKEIGNLNSLIKLSLFRNGLIEIPKEIGNLINLTYLSFNDNNHLKDLPASISKLKELKVIFVQVNAIPIEKLQQLKREMPNTTIFIGKYIK